MTEIRNKLVFAAVFASACTQWAYGRLDGEGGSSTTATTSTGTTAATGETGETGDETTGPSPVTGEPDASSEPPPPTTDPGTSTVDSSTGEPITSTTDDTSTGEPACGPDELPEDYDGEPYRLVFVTRDVFPGNMGDPDALCQTAAAVAGLPGTFRAWVRKGAVWPDLAVVGFERHDGWYIKLDGAGFVGVAHGWDELTGEDLAEGIDRDECGAKIVSGGDYVWTGLNRDGTPMGMSGELVNCNHWSDDNAADQDGCGDFDQEPGEFMSSLADFGVLGVLGAKNSQWSQRQFDDCDRDCCGDLPADDIELNECDQQHHLYCFQQGAP